VPKETKRIHEGNAIDAGMIHVHDRGAFYGSRWKYENKKRTGQIESTPETRGYYGVRLGFCLE